MSKSKIGTSVGKLDNIRKGTKFLWTHQRSCKHIQKIISNNKFGTKAKCNECEYEYYFMPSMSEHEIELI